MPVATVTTATIATVSLVSSKKEDEKLDSSREDTVLKDFDKPVEEFEEQIMLYSKDGTNEGKAISKEDLERLSKVSLDNPAKGPSSPSNIDKSDQSLPEESKKSVPEGDQSQVSMEAVEKFLGHGSEEDEKGVAKKIEENDPLASGAEDNKLKEVGGETTDLNSPKKPDEDERGTEEKGNHSQDNEGLGQQEIQGSKGQDLSQKASMDGGEDEEKMSTEKQGKIEPTQPAAEDIGGGEASQEQTPSNDNLPETGESKGAEANIKQPESEGDDQKGVSSAGDSSRDGESSLPETSGQGDDSSHSSSKGHEDGVSGEHGQKPMTQEQLQAIEKMGQEVEDVLGTLKNLFQISV